MTANWLVIVLFVFACLFFVYEGISFVVALVKKQKAKKQSLTEEDKAE